MSVLKIPIVLADGVSKLFFFVRVALVNEGKNIFRYNNGYKQRLDPLVAKRRQFSDFFSWARVKMRQKKEKSNGKGNSASALSRFASLSEGKMQV